MSYIYVDLEREDPRAAAVLDWLPVNCTLEENPAMGLQGYCYYLHLMSKALATLRLDRLKLKDGNSIDWRHGLAMRLINLEQANGSWGNSNRRRWDNDPNLVTAYSVMALEFIYPGLWAVLDAGPAGRISLPWDPDLAEVFSSRDDREHAAAIQSLR